MQRTRIKICCISSIDEAQLAIKYGADALGLVSSMPSGPGVISETLIKQIAHVIPPPLASVLLTSKQDTQEIIAQQKRCATNTIQICDNLIKGTYADLRLSMPGISIIQVLHVTGPEVIEQAQELEDQVDGFLLDSGNQSLKAKILGGTGKTHNWSISAKLREVLQLPIFLAGGLNPGNVAQAITNVKPFAVDVCSGVRTDGKLDETKLAAFVQAVISVQ
jgi:phosphoribosylanthranilate isomerase